MYRFLIVFLMMTPIVYGQEFILSEKGFVDFLAIGKPSFLKIHGKGAAPKGKVSVEGDKVVGNITFDLASLDTDNDLRNRHMKEKYLEVAKYPQATLLLNDIKLPKDLDVPNEVPFKGQLNLHGIEQLIDGVAKLERKDKTFFVTADFYLKMTDFKIETPSYMGISVVDKVKVHVETQSTM